MNSARPLFWHQGVYLQPQHFQLFDRSFQSLFFPYQKYMIQDFWGVGEMEILESALSAGTFTLVGGDFLFPDGTHVSLPGNALIEPRGFEESWVKDGKPLTVYLGLRNWSDEGENVTVLPGLDDMESVHTRFVASTEVEEFGDLHGGGPRGQVKRLYFVPKIFWETEMHKLGDYQLIPIAQVEKFGADVRLSTDYMPPCIAFSASGSLRKLAEEVRDQVTARAYQLEEHKSRRGVQTAEFGSRDMVYFLALRSINRYVPLLFHVTKSPCVHPWYLYGLLKQFVGELTTFSEDISVLGEQRDGKANIPDYDHRDLRRCFSALQDMISHLLDQITTGPEYVIRLVHDGTFYAAELKPAVFEGRNRYYLAVKTDADPKIVLSTLVDISKLSSREQMHTLVTQALPGIGLEYIQVPPQELPRRANTLYFTIDHHDDQWLSVERNRSLALYWHNAPDDAEVELMVVGR
ncbi:MAG: type VI secretion system baseplate subunit TssK [Geobacteraceae bacterium]|nr:type VI secretion system baseplate subunit TssK [Geobacteraceae bacterium]